MMKNLKKENKKINEIKDPKKAISSPIFNKKTEIKEYKFDLTTNLHFQFLLEVQRKNYLKAYELSIKILQLEPLNKKIIEFSKFLKENLENLDESESDSSNNEYESDSSNNDIDSNEEDTKENKNTSDDEIYNYSDDDSLKSDK